jgi:hypothetical protein
MLQVHSAHHSTVPSLGPLLSQALQQQLQHTAAGSIASTNSSAAISPFYTHSACFAGCVQLIANVFVLGDPAAAAAGSDCSSDSDDEGTGSSSNPISTAGDSISTHTLQDQRAAVASGLLARVSSMFNSAAAHFADSVGAAESWGSDDRAVGFRATEGAEVVPQHIDVMVGGAAASTGNSTATGTSSSSSVGAKPAAAATATEAATAASLLHCQPCCLVANESQQLRLTVDVTLANSGNSSSSSVQVPCRLLAVQQGHMLVDEDVTVILQPGHGSNKASINIALPELAAGLMHVALLPGSKPPGAEAAFCSAHIHDSCSSSDDEQTTAGAAAAAPTSGGLLLLQPLLVLPAAAAAELQAFGQAAAIDAAAACIDTPRKCAGSNCDDVAAAAVWEVVSALTVDVAYLLSAADEMATTNKVAAAAAVGEQSVNNASGLLPAGVAAVLSHMCQHLAAWQCWQLMHFLVERMHTAAAPEQAAAPASPEQAAAAAAEESAAGNTENENMPAAIDSAVAGASCSTRVRSSEAREVTGITASEVTAASAAAVEYEPGTKPNTSASSSSSNVSPSDGSSSSSSSLGTTKQLPAADTAATHDELVAAAADEASRFSSGSKLASSLSQLMFGFRSIPLELSYLDYITMQTYAVDAFEAIFALAVGLSANVLTDELQVHFAAAGSAAAAGFFSWWSSAAFWLAAWEIASRALNFASLVVPNFVLLLNRHRLGRGGR